MDEPLLAIDGALETFSVALRIGEKTSARAIDGGGALEGGIGLVESLLQESGICLREIGGIAVGTGPGKFTGLRIAIAYAKSLAFGARVPLVGISSFDIIDATPGGEERIPRLTVVRGRKGIVCARRTDRSGTRIACGLVEPTIARLIQEGDAQVTIVAATEDVREAVGKRVPSVLIVSAGTELPAAILARVARNRPAAASAHAVAPDYGELPAVKTR